MTRCRWLRTLLPATLACVVWTTSSPAADAPSIADLAWLAGCWEGGPGAPGMEEQWMAPRGRTMLGMNRTARGDTLRAHEYLMIREEEGRLVYVASPSGQVTTPFASIEVSPTRIVFENAAHDFPQRIIYERRPDGSLLVRIEGEREGRLRGVDFPLRRAPCPGGAEP